MEVRAAPCGFSLPFRVLYPLAFANNLAVEPLACSLQQSRLLWSSSEPIGSCWTCYFYIYLPAINIR
jgi:hypothetical protein